MRKTPIFLRLIPLALVAAAPRLALADDPTFKYDKQADVKAVEYKASAQLGVLGAYGNSQAFTLSGGLNFSRNDGWNKVTLDASGAWATGWARALAVPELAAGQTGANITQAMLDAAAGHVAAKDTVANAIGKLRYDRFFDANDSLYISAGAATDRIALKTTASGQIGYSRLLLKSDMHNLAIEAGYDLTYLVVDNAPAVDPIHSARIFLGYVLTLRKETAINASVETFINGNTINIGPAYDPVTKVGDPNSHKGFAEASRFIAKLGLTTQIYKMISFKFGLALKFDNAPTTLAITATDSTGAAIKLPDALPAGVYLPRADQWDFLGDAAIVVTFL